MWHAAGRVSAGALSAVCRHPHSFEKKGVCVWVCVTCAHACYHVVFMCVIFTLSVGASLPTPAPSPIARDGADQDR